MENLAIESFNVLHSLFLDSNGIPIKFSLRDKSNTQDDPFDEYIASSINDKLQSKGIKCQKSSGPLISPDMAVFKVDLDISNPAIENNVNELIGIEVKKLERSKNGKIARPTGMDYNSTPPCGKIKIFTQDNQPIVIKGYYLFACLENDKIGNGYVNTLCLCDGSIINDDFSLYSQITGSREKGINIGTYGDGANRNRPMLIFANPLGADILDKKFTLISGIDLGETYGNMRMVWRFIRTDIKSKEHTFYVYMDSSDVDVEKPITEIKEPFPIPQKRVKETQGRGKFRLEL